MKASGVKIKLMAKASSGMLTAIFMMASGRTTKLMAMASTLTLMGRNTRATGRTICSTEEGWKLGVMAVSTKESIRKA